MSKQRLFDIHSELSDHLERIRKLFNNPKITLIVRNPGLTDGDLVLSDDDFEKAIAAIRHLQVNASHVIEHGELVKRHAASPEPPRSGMGK